MEFAWSAEHEAFRASLRAFIAEHRTPALIAELEAPASQERGPEALQFRRALGEAGYVAMAWPPEYGGQGRGALYSFLLAEELAYWGLPFDRLSVHSVGASIMEFGSEQQKNDWLPKILSGDMTLAIGYTEPDAGTDLAALKTRAVRDGDEWVLNGQKIFTSGAHVSTHIWLAARTDPTAPKHRGISMFVFPLNTPGVSVRPLYTMGRIRTNETFYEDVRIPAAAMVGEQNRGWYIVAHALDFERVAVGPYSPLQRMLDDVVAYLKRERPATLRDPAVRVALAEAKLDVEIARALATTNAAMIEHGLVPTMQASMSKVWASDAQYRIANTVLDLLGPAGALQRESGTAAPLNGAIEEAWRGSPIGRFGAGTNDIQRRIIATRGLGLPRE